MKIAVGLSGGVDSSVTAALLKDQGHDIIGVTMKIWDGTYKSSGTKSSCFSQDESHDINDAQKICDKLEIPFYVIDVAKKYNDYIIGYFKDEYQSGRTPNPCVMCNHQIKFGAFLDKAKEEGIEFDYFATGHYAKISYNENIKRYQLKKAAYLRKDQSYFLTFLSQVQLSKVIFPLGNYTKEEVRDIAKKYGLHTHDKIESQDFYSGDYTELLDNTPNQGNFVYLNGKILGKHKGISYYTIGQRKGLGISFNKPAYVVKIDKDKNEVVIGEDKDLFKQNFIVKNVNWVSIEAPNEDLHAKTRIRYMHQEAESSIKMIGNGIYSVDYFEAQKSITPGQIAVFYNDDILLGGGIIQ
jgi:tRNA-uridine 2-sulfurtransferase